MAIAHFQEPERGEKQIKDNLEDLFLKFCNYQHNNYGISMLLVIRQ